GSSWSVDNVVVSKGTPYSWLSFVSPTSGTATGGATNTINLTCSAAGLVARTYEANITAATNDPANPTKVVNVQFLVETGGTPPSAPINVTTVQSGTDITVSWDAVSGATSYDVYSSADPYGTFTFVTNVATNQYVATASESKLFWYVVAKN
ncbi:MAG TPA: hypothetical protein PKW56_08820, partial [Clostridiales bacterium]|nr:hypothetical protein [Clostridiales bacterium]